MRVFEVVTENLVVKHRVFGELDKICPERTILASNTSSFMPSQLATATRRPDRVLVTHHFSPPYLMPLVEIVGGADTSPDVVSVIHDLLTKVGKRPVIIKKELTGFLSVRLQAALQRECLSLVHQGIVTAEDVDTVVKNSFGRRLAFAGPLEDPRRIGNGQRVRRLVTGLSRH